MNNQKLIETKIRQLETKILTLKKIDVATLSHSEYEKHMRKLENAYELSDMLRGEIE